MSIVTKIGRAEDDPSYARIGYESKLNSASSTDAEAVLIPNTWERWTSASGTMQETFQTSSASKMNYIAIGAHNLGTKGSEVLVETSPTVAGTWTARGSATPTDNKPIFFLFDDVDTVADVRVTITGGTDREVGVIYAGEVLIMQRAIYGGHSPIVLSSVTDYQSAISDSGQFLGRTITRKGQRSSFSWSNLTPDWYREKFQPFVNSAKSNPFFIKWRPDKFSDEVAFGFTTGDIKPTNSGGGTSFLDVNLSMRAHDE